MAIHVTRKPRKTWFHGMSRLKEGYNKDLCYQGNKGTLIISEQNVCQKLLQDDEIKAVRELKV